jgi:LmbE family N-acetylglucosaminyl deacetylase
MRGQSGRTLLNVAGWLGMGNRGVALAGPLVVISPHLDDAIFSLGAAIARTARSGASVTVLTVLAGDPESTRPAGPWDAHAGFRTAGEAARVRREEDRRACAIVGSRPAWLPFSDGQYERGADDETIAGAVLSAVGATRTVLFPGFPLEHKDHAWLSKLMLPKLDRERVLLYAEQPYAANAERWGGPASSVPLAATLPDRLKKVKACRAYSSQITLLGRATMARMLGFEATHAGELIALPNAIVR